MNVLSGDGTVTEILEPGPEISPKELTAFRKQFSGCLELCRMVVLSGSIPQGVPVDIYARLIRECRQAGCKVCLDASGELLRQGLEAKPDMVKPNRRELEYLAGRELSGMEEIKAQAARLLDKGVGKVVVSLGTEGLLYMDQKQELYQAACRVRTANTVGCGDTVVASMCMSELSGEDAQTALKKAAALAAANATTRENGEIPMERYLELLQE